MVSMSTRSLLPRSLHSLGPVSSSSSSRGKMSSVASSFPSTGPSSPSSSSSPSGETGPSPNSSTGRRYCRLENREELPRCSLAHPQPSSMLTVSSRTSTTSRIPHPLRRLSLHPSPSYRPPWLPPLSTRPPLPFSTPLCNPLLARAFHSSPTFLATEAPPTPTVPVDLSVKEQDDFRFRKKQDESFGVHLIVDQVEKHELSEEQDAIFQRALAGESFFFTGAAGTGKSFLLRKIIEELEAKNKTVAVCSSTGISAVNIGGTTIHSWAGIGLGRGRMRDLVNRINDKASRRGNWRKTDVLILDEVSMISAKMFDTLEELARIIRGSKDAFGRMQVIVTGDFLQLPPVYIQTESSSDDDVRESLFAFEANCWDRTLGTPLYLEQIFRQKDPTFIHHLNKVRIGQADRETAKFFSDLQRKKWKDNILPTKLFSTVAQVSRENLVRLRALRETTWKYDAFDAMDPHLPLTLGDQLSNTLKTQISIPRSVELKVGAQVMCRSNIFAGRVVNGSVGIVEGFMTVDQAREQNIDIAHNGFHPATEHWDKLTSHHPPGFPTLAPVESSAPDPSLEMVHQIEMGDDDPSDAKFPLVSIHNTELDERMLYLFRPVTFVITVPTEDNPEELVAVRKQLPLVLGYAVTIHKSQGQSIDRVSVDCNRIFADGQAYVALSRARSLEGLHVTGFMLKHAKAHPKVLAWMRFHGMLAPDPRFVSDQHVNALALPLLDEIAGQESWRDGEEINESSSYEDDGYGGTGGGEEPWEEGPEGGWD